MTGQGRWEETIPTETPHVLVCQGSDEWSALYVDGELVRHGDHYLIDEQLRVMFDVVSVQTNDFLTRENGRDGAAKTLDEVRHIEAGRTQAKRLADEKRDAARQLLKEADELEKA